ncbi:hypothetical protein AX16_010261 [Volvariella volvacea WC 439]|nr:hypothetical protein AX16_010261 [Volvariella volvacea WC 439]
MPIFSNITNLPTYLITRTSNPLLQNEPSRNYSTAKQPTISTRTTPVDVTLQYPTRPNTPFQPIRGHSITPPPSPTLSTRGINYTGPYHVDSDEKDPNDIKYSPAVTTTNPTRHSDLTEDVITQSNLDIGNFEFQELSRIQSPSSTNQRPVLSSDPPPKRKRLGWWTPPPQSKHQAPWSVSPKRNPFEFLPPSRPPPPVVKCEDDEHTPMHQPAGATSAG